MRGHRCILSLLVILLAAFAVLAQAPPAATPDNSALVRLSFVQGQVSVLEGSQTQFEQAQANMPLFAGNALATGQDGQAEVEFVDGSVARVSPNSRLMLMRLPGSDARSGPTELELQSGLAYFELNTSDGQHYTVHFGAGLAQPTDNSIFRIDLDNAPELAVFAGSVHATADGAFDKTVSEGQSLHFSADDLSDVTLATNIRADSWDRWNQDRDSVVAQESQQQTAARETSGAGSQPGWDDLDAYGDWYPTEDYGNVWVPSNEPTGWDPFGSGYWANYPGWGYTWISGYSWGWLPYHCGAWNYWNSFGWGWVPGQCGLGWQPIVTIWNAPSGFRPPPRPIPGGHIGEPIGGSRLLAVNRGPALPGNGLMHNTHTRPVRVDGQRLDPLPVMQDPTLGGRLSYNNGGHVGVPLPVGRSYGNAGSALVGNSHVMTPGGALRPGAGGAPAQGAPRPVFRPSPIQQTPHISEPPRVSAPAPHMAAPAPHISAPAASAPHVSAPAPAPSGGGHR